MTYDDELEQPFISIYSDEAPNYSGPPSDAVTQAILGKIAERPRLAENPRRLYDEFRQTRHDISHDDISHVLSQMRLGRLR